MPPMGHISLSVTWEVHHRSDPSSLLLHGFGESGLGRKLLIFANASRGRCPNPTQSLYQPSAIGIVPDLACQAPSHCYNVHPESSVHHLRLYHITAPLVEDMLQEAGTGLTKAVVIGPGRAVLFYGRCSLGEGLKVDEVRDATFLLTGAGTWVGKSAYLTANPMTIPEDKRATAQAVSNNRVRARGLGCPRLNPPAQQPFWFNVQRTSPLKDVSGDHSPDYP